MAVAIRRCLRRSAAVEALVEDWHIADGEGIAEREVTLASDLEELCHECLDLCALLRHTWAYATKAMFDGRLFKLDAIGSALKRSLDKALGAIGLVLAACEDATSRGAEIDGMQALQAGVNDMESIRQKLLAKWPFTDKKLIAESRAAFARGDYDDIGELLHGLNDNGASAN
jgi:hypothetical protein